MSAKIDRFGLNGVASADKTGSSAGAGTVSLRGDAMQLQDLDRAVSDAPFIDVKRVEILRRAIADGAYTISNERIASKLIQSEASLRAF